MGGKVSKAATDVSKAAKGVGETSKACTEFLKGLDMDVINGSIESLANGSIESLQGTANTVKLVGAFTSFSLFASPILGVTQTIIGAQAYARLEAIAKDVSESLRKMSEAAQINTALAYQQTFAKTVYDFVNLRIRQTTQASGRHYFLVFHPGTDWHGTFSEMVTKEPLPGLIGVTNNLEILGLYAEKLRTVIGEEAMIHVLLPSAHMYVVDGKIDIPATIGPVSIEGQLHCSGQPYVWLDITDATLTRVDIHEVGIQSRPFTKTWARKVAYESAGVGGAVAGTTAGFFGSLVGVVILEDIAVCAAIASGPIGWAAVGVATVGGGIAAAIASRSAAKGACQEHSDKVREERKKEAMLRAREKKQAVGEGIMV